MIKLRQGFGRLIRTKSDRGAVVVLDKRVLSKSYGPLFLNSLPECKEWRASVANLPGALKRWLEEQPTPGS